MLHDSVARATLAAGAAAVAGLFLPASLAAALMALAVGVAVVPPTNLASGATALMWALAAAAGGKIGGGVGNAIAGVAIGGSVARGLPGRSRMVAMLVGTVGAMTAALVGRAFALTDALAALPNGIATLVTGATGGFIVGVSSIGRHLALAHAPLEHELTGMADDSELGRLLGRAAAAYRDAIKAIGGEAPAARAAADELVGKMTRFGRRWRELELEAARVNPADLKERLQLVGARLESTHDPLARAELARAREAVATQLAYVEEIAGGRERALARLEHQVATLERLRWAALRVRSADAARLGAELAPVVEELTEAGGDFDIAAEALSEATVAGALPAAARN
ncbi:MAG TPA: hypothetical protein VN947_00355 [Polyangia bacterium]|nr:hypothetical protein [Polyangia bacterium]